MNIDSDKNGVVSEDEAEAYEKVTKTELLVTRDQNQIRLAWVSMGSILSLTLLLLTNIINTERIKALEDILELFYVVHASIIGFYVGATTYINSKSGTRVSTTTHGDDNSPEEESPR